MNAIALKNSILAGECDGLLSALYSASALEEQKTRYADALDAFVSLYGDRPVKLFSVPGRSEISGNHTDHNHGRVLAAAINLDIIAVASPSEENQIRIKSAGFDEDVVPLDELSPDSFSNYSSGAIIAGMCDGFAKRGFAYGGFCAYTTSNVFKGSGLSSSAAFEVMVGNILNHFFNNGVVDAPEIAKIAQYAENVFFGKPCGLMDQTACAVGGFVAIDFNDPKQPVIEKMGFDLSEAGYSLCIINTGGNHADLNEDYASVPAEMKKIASYFGQEVLRGLTADDIIARAAELREKEGDRAILRALHFIGENDRVAVQTRALKENDLKSFFEGEIASGNSSFKWLQNVYTTKNVSEQGLSLALAVAEEMLDRSGKLYAVRVHGGGFAGTIQAFVPTEESASFKAGMEKVFGEGSCYILRVRPEGAIMLNL